jgi:hypothetical protein
MVDRLIDIIGSEATVFESFLSLLEQQKEALVANDVDRLNEVTKQQQETLLRSRQLAREREREIESIRNQHSLEGDLSLSRLLELVDDAQARQLSRLQELILGLNDQITDARNTNVMLLNQSRKFVAKTLELMAGLSNPRTTYRSGGQEERRESALAVDRRV